MRRGDGPGVVRAVSGKFITRPSFEIVGLGRFRLLAPLVYESERSWMWADGYGGYVPMRRFDVPAGFECDLASVPKILATIAPSWDQTAGSGILHDWTFRHGRLGFKASNALFYEALRAPPATGAIRAYAMWLAVSGPGWLSWKARRRDDP